MTDDVFKRRRRMMGKWEADVERWQLKARRKWGCCDMHGTADWLVMLSQEMKAVGSFEECPKCDMQDWSHRQQAGDLISVFSEARPLLGIYSDMAGVSTCPAKDWSSAHQQADLVNVFLHVAAEARSILIPPTHPPTR